MTRALLSLGSNIGDRRATLNRAIELLTDTPHIRVGEHSAFYATKPVGGPSGQGEFLNGAAIVETKLKSSELLGELQRIEQALGRQRHERWDARTIDLDLLLYGNQRLRTPELTVPHPRMSFRPFVLVPACEVADDWIHPVLNAKLEDLFWQLQNGEHAIAIFGGSLEEQHHWAARLQILRPFFGPIQNIPVRELCPACLYLGPQTRIPAPPKLSISLDNSSWKGVPRLSLADCDPAHFAAEIDAAIECVWPTAG